MNPLIPMILLSSLGLGTTLTFASSHWLLAWMGLEINTLAIIPMMSRHHHPRAVEAATKYFLIQATAAALILFASLTNAWLTGTWNVQQLTDPTATTLAMMGLALKIGLAPAHFWLPEVLQGLDLTMGLILSTWQKLAPFALIYQIAPTVQPTLLITLGIMSALIGGWGGLNQTQLRKILAYSSIAHLGWMIIILQLMPPLTILNLAIYITMTTTMFLSLKTSTTTKINTMATSWAKTPALATMTTLALLSLGGLPPLTGFMPKWLIIQELTKQNLNPTAMVMAMAALLSLFFYLRLCYTTALTISPNTNNTTSHWRTPPTQTNPTLPLTMTGTIMLLPITPAILSLTS
ncbi:NADH dehydrogenase subunit 2 (mitochondrion) [Megalops cyprinoides]|uniref:NADH-ubiquinone oxidoreductase chain 2 n=1 Tax=Megalops cyprinoides TaxID=118141 RepID=Q76MB7_9TELE|nr:NADH dehydrogenase subunit 2 [Megalops cyprinoides]BAD12287.1 NADH dehydrogenase subunit 2 [Megalops cyprinoides]